MNRHTLIFLLAAASVATPIQAHHSFATFDVSKQVTLVGTVKDFQWTNPHTWIYLTVLNNNNVESWEIEGGPVVGLKRQGWSKDSIKVGDKVTVLIHPKRDGSHGGSFIQVTLPDGKTLGQPNIPAYTETAKPPAGSTDQK
jgi:hypothetical protein